MPTGTATPLREILGQRARGAGFYRALHGFERPGLPRFHVDRFGDAWIVTFRAVPTPGADEIVPVLADTAAAVVFRHRDPERPERSIARVVAGTLAPEIVVEHAGYRFRARPLDPIDPGAYPDSEPLREALAREATGKRVLNLFAYTCLNGVVALRAGARSVVNVDLAHNHLARGKANYRENGLAVDDRDFVARDALGWCARGPRAAFDLIVIDPPPHLRRGPRRVPSADLIEETLAAALPLAARGATIHLLQCAARISPDELRERASAAAPGARISVETGPPLALSPFELAPTYKDAVVALP
jgi:23S rRNA (cytosine1962-C5)-methyltransferase